MLVKTKIRCLFTWILITLLGPGISCTAQKESESTKILSPVESQTPSVLELQVDSIIQPLVDSMKIAGIGVGIVQDGSTRMLKSYRKADLEFDTPLPVNAIFEIGYITRQFTAVAILQLVEKGLID